MLAKIRQLWALLRIQNQRSDVESVGIPRLINHGKKFKGKCVETANDRRTRSVLTQPHWLFPGGEHSEESII